MAVGSGKGRAVLLLEWLWMGLTACGWAVKMRR